MSVEGAAGKECKCEVDGSLMRNDLKAKQRPAGLIAFNVTDSTFKQSKRRIKMAVLMLPLPTKATTEEKRNICTD